MRAIMTVAEPNLRAFDMEPAKWWDCAARHGMLQKRWVDKVMAGEATCQQLERAVGAPWGAVGEVALLPGSPARKKDGQSKQLQKRMVSCMFLGVMGDGRRTMRSKQGKTCCTMHVAWRPDAMPAAPQRAVGDTDEAEQEDEGTTRPVGSSGATMPATGIGHNGGHVWQHCGGRTNRHPCEQRKAQRQWRGDQRRWRRRATNPSDGRGRPFTNHHAAC